ncbi:MAG: saccharopine dehydrogenase [Sphingomonadales bacterium]|nr:saccharopine dehydrogenase [Sphingomonadales bacterium]
MGQSSILILGAGRSATNLIDYLLGHAAENQWMVTIADLWPDAAERASKGHPNARAVAADLSDKNILQGLLKDQKVVISLLPAEKHPMVARMALQQNVSLFTASYVSPGIQQLDEQVKKAGLLFLNELGCDPGIDHMSTMELMGQLKSEGAIITGFYSYTGGLVAPECDDHPWHYKFSWNPRNVVLAGAPGPAQYRYQHSTRHLPYPRLFREPLRVDVPGVGMLDAYPNRDSLPYTSLYGLEDIPTLLRATFRYPGFMQGWSVLVHLGLTLNHYRLEAKTRTRRDLLMEFLPPHYGSHPEQALERVLSIDMGLHGDQITMILDQFRSIGFFESIPLPDSPTTPAEMLEHILLAHWSLLPSDRDRVVMHHRADYERNGELRTRTATLDLIGKDATHTAMAQTVGLPLAIAVRLFMQGTLMVRGVHIPTREEIYRPILRELSGYGIHFKETDTEQLQDPFIC